MKKRTRQKLHSLWIAGVLLLTSAPAAAEDRASAVVQPTLSFAVISDIHVQHWNTRTRDKLKRAMNDLHNALPGAAALVVNGDLGDGLPADYAALHKLMGALPHPPRIYYNIGNHEYYKAWVDAKGAWSKASFPNGETEQASQQRFLKFAGRNKLYEDAWVSGYHFIFLGSEHYRQSDPGNLEDAWLSDAQLSWLDKSLADQEQLGKPIFVFLHQPLPYTVAGSHTSFNSRGVVQHKRLMAILSKHPQVILFSGHTHWELKSKDTFVRSSFTMVNSSSVADPFSEADTGYDLVPGRSEGLAVKVYPDRVLISGRNFMDAAWIPEAQFEVKQVPSTMAAVHAAQADGF